MSSRDITIEVCTVAFFITIICLCVLKSKQNIDTNKPKLYAEVDGCKVYRFEDKEGLNYFVRCANGKEATTDANGKHIITEKD